MGRRTVSNVPAQSLILMNDPFVHHQASLWAQRVLGELPIYATLSAGGGVRQERLGSFRQARYPLGFGLGLRMLAGERAGARIEYRYRRILDDPVRDLSEHQLRVGLSLYLRNSR